MTARKGSLEKPAKLAAQAAVSLGNSHTGKARARVCAPIRSEAARQAPCRTFREHNAGAACGSRWGARTEQGNAKMQKANAFLRSPVNNCTPATGGQKWQKKQTESGLPFVTAVMAAESRASAVPPIHPRFTNIRRPAGGAAGGISRLLRKCICFFLLHSFILCVVGGGGSGIVVFDFVTKVRENIQSSLRIFGCIPDF